MDKKIAHIAIIMDGNRRWAKEKKLATAFGHKRGAETLKNIVRHCDKIGIKYLTVYAFSTENWKRTQEEVDFLQNLLISTLEKDIYEMHSNNVKVRFIGDLEVLPQKILNVMMNSEKLTKNNTGVNFQIAFNYGARNEITNTVKKIIQKGIPVEKITEEIITENLYTSGIPDPDLLIRTGGEQRLSNYLLWQMAYSEIYVTNEYWPEFNEESFELAIKEFYNRKRRFGK